MTQISYQSWGRLTNGRKQAVTLGVPIRRGMRLPFGNGRSYGDSCHNDAGTLVDCRASNAILILDETTDTIAAQAGVFLSDILAAIVPKGYFLPVTPGTQAVTLGGAIANDVHGKNHHIRGTFGAHILSLTLQKSDGTLHACSHHENVELFRATIGGMGLTGTITEATLRLMPVTNANIDQTTVRFDHLKDYFEQIEDIDATHEYSVAWIDQLCPKGRGVLMGGNHSIHKELDDGKLHKPRLSVPFTPPMNMLNTLTLKAFNSLYYNKEKIGKTQKTVPWRNYFYPLDGIANWNRLYGPRGLYQHQSVYPLEGSYDTTQYLLNCARNHGHASFLTVLKRFGGHISPALFSFPQEGITLTLDFANSGAATRRLLGDLDKIVIERGGAINPYKDARMSASVFAASFPNWKVLENQRDPAHMSDFWQRTAMTLISNHGATN